MTDRPSNENTFVHWWRLRSKDAPLYLARCVQISAEAFAAGYASAQLQADDTPIPAAKTGTCGHPALYRWHYTKYERVDECLYCKVEKSSGETPDELPTMLMEQATFRLQRIISLQSALGGLIEAVRACEIERDEWNRADMGGALRAAYQAHGSYLTTPLAPTTGAKQP